MFNNYSLSQHISIGQPNISIRDIISLPPTSVSLIIREINIGIDMQALKFEKGFDHTLALKFEKGFDTLVHTVVIARISFQISASFMSLKILSFLRAI